MKRRGVSLPELILSFFLLLLTVLLIFQMYPMALASLRLSGQRSQAEALADSELADFLTCPFSQLVVGPEQPLPDVEGRGTVFHSAVTISAVNQPGVDPDGIRSVRIRVFWTEKGTAREIVREQWRADVAR